MRLLKEKQEQEERERQQKLKEEKLKQKKENIPLEPAPTDDNVYKLLLKIPGLKCLVVLIIRWKSCN